MMIFLFVYLTFGFIYAVYILTKGTDKWVWFPVNVIFGPVTVLYLFFMTLTGKKLPKIW